MAAATTQSASKSSKKKAAKAIERTESPAPSNISAADRAGDDHGFHSPYIREIQKNIRNVTKKIGNASKLDAILKEHPGKSVDDLVSERVINADQKQQILKKPGLQAQLVQWEEQVVQYIKVDEQYRAQAASEKAETDKALQKAKEEATAKAKELSDKDLRGSLLLVSQFLRLAAYRREEAADPESDESQAIEGVLLAIYAGDEGAVNSMLKLVGGSSDRIVSVPGEQLETTFAQVKDLAQDYKTPHAEGAEQPAVAEGGYEVGTDPTVAHASATEIASGDVSAPTEAAIESASNGIANIQVTDDAANAVAESHWDDTNDAAMSQEWVEVPKDPTETDTGLEATPAAPHNTQSWADDHPDVGAEGSAATTTDPNDGFHQVQRNKGREGGAHRGRGRGGWRGRGQGDGGRGRGRGHRGGPRGGGPRRNEES